ncbi:MAG: glycosyltransferase [Pseudomonadota bacterium]
MQLIVLSALCLGVWIYLLCGRSGYWRADQRLDDAAAPRRWPVVAVVIPARDEAETIGPVIASHMASDYPGEVRIVLVDDQSADGTASLAREAAGAAPAHALTILRAEDLPDGWSGKLWALYRGAREAANDARQPEYFLFTDADIVHAPTTLRRLVAKAEAEGLALASLMAT